MASRTRDRLIDVARQLFVRQGYDNTTMNDIATASDRGRRTLYTYFTSKNEIYQAVIERETARIRQEIEASATANDSPAQRLRALINYRVALVQDQTRGYQVWIASLLSRDPMRSRKVRAMVADKIYEMIGQIVEDGIASGDFDPTQAQRLPAMLTMLVRGADWTVAHSEYSPHEAERWQTQCTDFIIQALQKNNKP